MTGTGNSHECLLVDITQGVERLLPRDDSTTPIQPSLSGSQVSMDRPADISISEPSNEVPVTESPLTASVSSLSMFHGASGFKIREMTVNYNQSPPSSPAISSLEPRAPMEYPLSVTTPSSAFKDALEWLNGVNFDNTLSSVLDQRTENTGAWFLESEEFREFESEHGVHLWGQGLRSGKTYLSAAVIEKLQQDFENRPDHAVAYVFLQHNDQLTALEILASLIAQILRYRETEPAGHLLHKLKQNCREGFRPPTKKELVKLLQNVASLVKVFVVIDGLDQTSDDVKEALLNSQSLPSVRMSLLVMSAQLPNFWSYIPDARHIEIKAHAGDIDLYVKQTVEECSSLRAVLQNDPKKIGGLCNLICQLCAGVFLVAQLQMSMLREVKTLNEFELATKTLSSDVDVLYKHTLDTIIKSTAGTSALAKKALIWLLYSRDRMRVEDLEHAISISADAQTFDRGNITPLSLILPALRGLVHLTKDQEFGQFAGDHVADEVHFAHFTVKDYLFRNVQHLGARNPHLLLCISYLTYLKAHTGLLNRLSTDSDDHTFLTSLRSTPLLASAYKNWGFHARDAGPGLANHPPFMSLLTSFNASNSIPSYTLHHPEKACMANGLHLAAKHGLVDIIQLNHPSLPCEPDPSLGYTPYHFAALNSDAETLRALLSVYGPDGCNLKTTHKGLTPLMLAIQDIRQDSMYSPTESDISGNGSPQNHQPNAQPTQASPSALSLLLNTPEIDCNIQDETGATALMMASLWGHPDAVRALILCPRVDHSLLDNNGQSALDWARGLSGINPRPSGFFRSSWITDALTPSSDQREAGLS